MSPARKDQLHGIVAICFSVLFFVEGFRVLTGRSSAFDVLILIAVVAGFIWLGSRSAKKRKLLIIAALDRSFAGFQGAKPDLKQGTAMGFPTFDLIFQSTDEMKAAEAGGFVDAFRSELSALHANIGGKRNPFNIDKAMSVRVRY